jgi:hypothetical protein
MTSKGKPRLNKRALFELLHYEPHPGQLAIHNSRAPLRVVACGVRWGKTMCAAMEVIAAAMQPAEHSVVWCIGPTYDLAERVFSKVALTVATHLPHRIVKLSEHDQRLILRNMAGGLSEVRGKSAENPVSLLGEGLDYVVMDECSRTHERVWLSHVSQRLVDKKGSALLISTPKGRGWFYDAWRRGQGDDPECQSWNQPSWTNPLLDAEHIEAQRGLLPERVFRQEYGAEFIEGAGAVFRNVRERALGEWQAARQGDTYSAGLDLAKVEDYTVISVLNQRREVVFVDRFHRLDWSLQITRLKAALDRYPCCYTLVDSTGAGEPVFEQLLRAGLRVQPYPFTAASKSNLVNNLSLALEQGAITLPKADLAPVLIDELESFEYSISDAGNTRMSAPSGVHDDCVMSLALALWQVGKGGAGTVSVLNLYSPGSRWTPLSRRLTYARRMALGGFRSG